MPTPVSALIHAATLVTAGLYLLLRSSPILEYSSTALLVITLVGATTAFFAATSGLVQNDIKRIIAFSTISQLGYVFLAIGLSQYHVALFHLANHAFFKALLFLGAGSVLHSFADQQDIRKMGSLIKLLPFTYTAMLIGSLSLLATPWLTGFYSKDLIIELAFSSYSFSGTYAFILGTLTAGLTAFYSVRLLSLVFMANPNGTRVNYLNSHEANNPVIIALTLLSLFSIFIGYFGSDLFTGVGSDFFSNSLFILPENLSLIDAEFSISPIIKLLPLILTFLGAVSALIIYNWFPKFTVDLTNNSLGRIVYSFLNSKYYFDVIYNYFIIGLGLKVGYSLSKIIDRGIIELVGPNGISNLFYNSAISINNNDTGNVTTYALYNSLSLIILVFLIFAPLLTDYSMFSTIRLIIIYIAALFATTV